MKKLAILAAAAAAITANCASAQAIWTRGHGDLGIAYEGGALDPHVHIHAGATVDGSVIATDAEYAPGDALPIIPFAKSLSRPAGSQWDFFGVSAGQKVWIFPQTQAAALPFIGFGAEELNPSDWTSSFTITLTGITGSGVSAGGTFSVYDVDGFGDPTVAIRTDNGISSADFVSLAAGGHAHYNFAFTQPGIYEATFSITGNHVADGFVDATATYSFQVVPEPTSLTLIALGGGAIFLRPGRKKSKIS